MSRRQGSCLLTSKAKCNIVQAVIAWHLTFACKLEIMHFHNFFH